MSRFPGKAPYDAGGNILEQLDRDLKLGLDFLRREQEIVLGMIQRLPDGVTAA